MYCDGLCPVFPALSGKQAYTAGDLGYLANLCHNCRGCWYACQYAPPHPFAVNVPAILAGLRRQSYADHVWPRRLGHAFRRPALGAALVAMAAFVTMLILEAAKGSPGALEVGTGAGSFYPIVPWALMAGLAGVAISWALASMTASTYRFWRTISPKVPARALRLGLGQALYDIVTLRHLGGGGPGCNDADIRLPGRRRLCHHIMVAGLILDFAATLAAAVYQDVLGDAPPYPLVSFPVCAGIVGGAAVVIGVGCLLALEARSDPAPSERGEAALNVVFLISLGVVALSGLALVALRETPALETMLLLHISLVVGLFTALPATKVLHAPFRAAALLRAAAEQPRGVASGDPDRARRRLELDA